jgi:predicted nucleic acid-binding Zn ribbon protein
MPEYDAAAARDARDEAIQRVEERALGAIMQRAARQGWIAPTDRTRKSIRPACHARDLRVWRSLLREAPRA